MQEITLMPGRMHGLARQQTLRGWLAILLLGAGGRLISWAWQVAPAPRRDEPATGLEFHGDADGAAGSTSTANCRAPSRVCNGCDAGLARGRRGRGGDQARGRRADIR